MYGDVLDRLSDRKPSRSRASKKARGSGGQASSPLRLKATFHLTVDDILVIDRLQSLEFSKTGKKPERSQIVSRALHLLARHHKVNAREGLPAR
jgi:hypothetical protein